MNGCNGDLHEFVLTVQCADARLLKISWPVIHPTKQVGHHIPERTASIRPVIATILYNKWPHVVLLKLGDNLAATGQGRSQLFQQ